MGHNSNNKCEISSITELVPTQPLTKSSKQMKRLSKEIDEAGTILIPIKYVVSNGIKHIVDGHHRVALAKRKGIKDIFTEEVKLPYKGYFTEKDLEYSQY